MSATSAFQKHSSQPGGSPARCPYYDPAGEICRASFSSLSIDPGRRRFYCASEDHDDCAIYLSKALRSNRPVGFALQSRELELK